MSRFNKQSRKTTFTFPSSRIPIRTDKRLTGRGFGPLFSDPASLFTDVALVRGSGSGALSPGLWVRGSARLITLTKATFVEGSARSDYSVEQQLRSQLGSKNQSDFLAKVKFAASKRQEGTGGTKRCSAATLRISGFVSTWLLECLSP